MEYWERGSGWKWNLLHDVLLTSDLVRLASIILTSDPNKRDAWGWMKTGAGKFSVKEAYRIANVWKEEFYWEDWKRIWRMKIQQRIRIFA